MDLNRILGLEQLPREGAIAAYIAGSAVDGLGNAWSDIDVYVIGNCAPVGAHVINNVSHQISIHYLEGNRYDFEFWHPEVINKIAAELDSFVDDQLGDDVTLTAAEQQFVHRLLHCVPCFGSIDEWVPLFDPKKLSQMQLYACVRQTDYLHEDICGMLESGDYASAMLLCRPMLENALGSLLHAHGNTIPTAKWRLRIAEKLLSHDPTLDDWWTVQFPPQLARSDSTRLRKYAVKCIYLAERLIMQAQR